MNIDVTKEARAIDEQQASLDLRKQALEAERRRLLEAEHKALRAECKLAQSEHKRLTDEAQQLQEQAFRTRSKVDYAQREVANWLASRPRPHTYPTDEELASWQRELRRREAAVKKAIELDAVPVQALLVARMARDAACEKFQRLEEQEADLRAKLDPPGPRPWATTRVDSSGRAII